MAKERPLTKYEKWCKLQNERIFCGYRRLSKFKNIQYQLPEETKLPKALEDRIKCPFTHIDYEILEECCSHTQIFVVTCKGYRLECQMRGDYIKSLTMNEALDRIEGAKK